MKWKAHSKADHSKKKKQLTNDLKTPVRASTEEIQIILNSKTTLVDEAAKKQVWKTFLNKTMMLLTCKWGTIALKIKERTGTKCLWSKLTLTTIRMKKISWLMVETVE